MEPTPDAPTPGPGPGQTRELNLQTMASQFMAGIQRHFDHLAYTLASRDSVHESVYTERVRLPGIMPAPPLHQNFEQMQAYAADLLQRQVIGDGMNLAVTALHNAHLFLALVKRRQMPEGLTLEAQRSAQEAQNAFLRLPLDQKFNRLEEEYKVMCPLEDTITSLGFAMQALVAQGGEVRAPQLDEQGELSFELKAARDIAAVTEIASSADRFGTRLKVLREGDRIAFSDLELQLVLITIAAFADQLFGSVARYAREAAGGGPA
jgi:hypothetical protein